MDTQNTDATPETPQNLESPPVSADAWLAEANASPPNPPTLPPPDILPPPPTAKRGRGRPPGTGHKQKGAPPSVAEAEAAIHALLSPDVLAPACVGFIDKGMATFFSLRYGETAQTISVANDAQKQALLVDAWKTYLGTMKIKLTPAQALVVTCALVYGEPIPQLEKIRSDMKKKTRDIN